MKIKKGIMKPINGAKAAAAVGIVSFGLCIGESLLGSGNVNAAGNNNNINDVPVNEVVATVDVSNNLEDGQTQTTRVEQMAVTQDGNKQNVIEVDTPVDMENNELTGEKDDKNIAIEDKDGEKNVNQEDVNETETINEPEEKDRPEKADETEKSDEQGIDSEPEIDDLENDDNQNRIEEFANRSESVATDIKKNMVALGLVSENSSADLMDMYPGFTEEMDNERYRLITGQDKQTYTVGHMPEGYRSEAEASKKMKTITVNVWKLRDDWTRYSSKMTLPVNAELADDVQSIFDEIYALDMKFPIKSLVGFKYRKVGGVGLIGVNLMSVHSFGCAIDINPGDYDNDYFLGKGNDLRDKSNPYCIPDEVIEIFENHGWFWGGNFEIASDTMHFQFFGLDFLKYDNPDEPFPVLCRDNWNNEYAAFINMEQRLVKLGYLKKQYKTYNDKVESAVKAFQEDNGLETTGVVDYSTWEPMINLTHDMNYVF